MDKAFYGKPTNTVFSVDSIIENEAIIGAKRLMNEHYGNKYSLIPPHLAYAIVPFPEYNFEVAKYQLLTYIKRQKPYKIEFSDLKYDEKNNLFSVEVLGKDIRRLHEDLTNILNAYRDNCVRAKDLERANSGYFSEKELEYIRGYGYARVFECFKPHISIGNFTIPNVDFKRLTVTLKELLSSVLNQSIVLNNIHTVFHTDAANQLDMKVIWEDTFTLL